MPFSGKVLVTGAAGRIGREICRHLAEGGHSLRLTDITEPPALPGAEAHAADLRDSGACTRLLDGVDALVHFGNIPNLGTTPPQSVYADNTRINANVFEAAHRHGTAKILFASSIQAVAGNTASGQSIRAIPYLPLDGGLTPHPANPYALSKAAAEDYLLMMSRLDPALQAIALRLPSTAPLETTLRAAASVTPRNVGDFSVQRRACEAFSYLLAEEAAGLVEACLHAVLPGFRAYLPASRGTFLSGLFTIPQVIGRYFPGVPLRAEPARLDSLVDISRITAETGWQPGPCRLTGPHPQPG